MAIDIAFGEDIDRKVEVAINWLLFDSLASRVEKSEFEMK